MLHTSGARGLALRRGRGLLLQQVACESVLAQELGVMHVPSQHAPLLPQLTPVVPASRHSNSWIGEPVGRRHKSLYAQPPHKGSRQSSEAYRHDSV